MLVATTISLLIIIITVFVHYTGLRGIAGLANRWDTSRYFVPPLLMFLIALLHLVEIVFYGWVFYLLDQYTGIGGFTSKFEATARDYLYFSGANYTTLGMSNFYPEGGYKILSISEALAGFMVLTWSATFFYSTAGQFFNRDGRDRKN